jgi:hypothetical protein
MKKVLIINDQPGRPEFKIIATLLSDCATDNSYQAQIAESPHHILKTDQDDLIVFMSSYSAKNAIVAKKVYPANKIYLFTGLRDFDDMAEVVNAGILVVNREPTTIANDFIKKILKAQ